MVNTHTQASNGRKQVRAPIKEGPVELRNGEYEGRNGEILKRSPFKHSNKFDIPDDVKEPGWSYQWIRHSIYNNTEYSEMASMKRAGWREVHPDALKGYFREQTPEGQNYISDEGLVLVERPAGMTRDAHNEALALANKHFQGQVSKIYDPDYQLPSGFKSLRGEYDQGAPEPSPKSWKPEHRPRQIGASEE